MLKRFCKNTASATAGRAAILVFAACLLIPIVRADRSDDDRLAAADDPAAVDANEKLEEESAALRSAVPGKLQVHLRSRSDEKTENGVSFVPDERVEEWNVAETAIIICDMWDGHYCELCAERVDTLAPEMNRVISAARSHGVAIVHAPSGCMDEYANTPFRRRLQNAPAAEPPIPIQPWCYLDPKREGELPINDTRSPCDDPVVGPMVKKFTKQHDAIRIIGFDGISDDGTEIYNYLTHLGIRNVVLMGVHANMCVLGRPFGIRQLKDLGFNVAMARDLTDAMYDPREYPYVSHARGTELIVEHIEKHWCPSLLGDDLTRVIPGSADPDLPAAGRRRAAEAAADQTN